MPLPPSSQSAGSLHCRTPARAPVFFTCQHRRGSFVELDDARNANILFPGKPSFRQGSRTLDSVWSLFAVVLVTGLCTRARRVSSSFHTNPPNCRIHCLALRPPPKPESVTALVAQYCYKMEKFSQFRDRGALRFHRSSSLPTDKMSANMISPRLLQAPASRPLFLTRPPPRRPLSSSTLDCSFSDCPFSSSTPPSTSCWPNTFRSSHKLSKSS